MIQIIAKGLSDGPLIQGPSVTFWRLRTSTHTNFALEQITQTFGTAPQFGQTSYITLNRTGDMVFRQYIIADLPGLFPVVTASYTSPYMHQLDALASAGSGHHYLHSEDIQAGAQGIYGHYACWVDAVGLALIKRVKLIVGSHIIDQVPSDYLYMYEELTGSPGRRLEEMVGRFHTLEQRIAHSGKELRVHVPLPFWYTQVAGNALSLVSLSFHGVQLEVQWQALAKLVQVSNSDVKVYKATTSGGNSGVEIADSHLSASVQTEYVYLDVQERNRFAEGLFDQLICTTQEQYVTTTESSLSVNLLFNHPVAELIFAARLVANETHGDWTNFGRSGPAGGAGAETGTATFGVKPAFKNSYQVGGGFDIVVPDAAPTDDVGNSLVSADGRYALGDVVLTRSDIVASATIKVNNLCRVETQTGQWFTQVQSYQHHTALPTSNVMCYSFALHPEEYQPSGALNFSRLDSVTMEFVFHEDVASANKRVIIFARNWNVFSYRFGMGGNKYCA